MAIGLYCDQLIDEYKAELFLQIGAKEASLKYRVPTTALECQSGEWSLVLYDKGIELCRVKLCDSIYEVARKFADENPRLVKTLLRSHHERVSEKSNILKHSDFKLYVAANHKSNIAWAKRQRGWAKQEYSDFLEKVKAGHVVSKNAMCGNLFDTFVLGDYKNGFFSPSPQILTWAT